MQVQDSRQSCYHLLDLFEAEAAECELRISLDLPLVVDANRQSELPMQLLSMPTIYEVSLRGQAV